MLNTKSFYDLCLQEAFFLQENIEECLKILYDYGYRTVAINHNVEEGNIEPKKKKKKGEPRETVDIVPLPYIVDKFKEVMKKLNLEHFKLLSRLTISFSNQEILHKITKSPNFKKYDIIAALPTSTQAVTFTCSTFEADIFTFDPENKFTLRVNRKMYNHLIERGYHFELLYGPAIIDSSKRKNLIHAAHLFHSFGKSKNIIFSSGADSLSYIRNPYDIINLGYIFGLSTLQSKNAVSYCPQRVVLNSVGRRHGKAVMFVENIDNHKEQSDIAMSQEIEDEEQEDMETDQPKLKKTKL